MKGFLVCLFAVAMTACAPAQTLWQNTVAGMKKKEVEKLYPKPAEVQLFKRTFWLGFRYKDDGLISVGLILKDKLGSRTEVEHLYTQIAAALSEKYGQRVSVEATPGMPVKAETWQASGILVKLEMLDAGHLSTLNITYSKQQDSEATKL